MGAMGAMGQGSTVWRFTPRGHRGQLVGIDGIIGLMSKIVCYIISSLTLADIAFIYIYLYTYKHKVSAQFPLAVYLSGFCHIPAASTGASKLGGLG